MSLSEKLSDDLKKAMKTRDKDTLSVVRMIKAAVKNKEIEKGAALLDEEIYAVLNSMVRQRKDSIEQFSKAGRDDLVKQETKELSIVQSYLPPQLSEDEVKRIINNVIAEVGASTPKDIGKVMKSIMPKVKGQIDSKLLSELVKKALTYDS
ncbi:MAG: GatB/YqeY domain-containing protein [Nitrospirae bacterium]|nr:GatB/YqeY domain-containing protein [Nitrospirota bacterium]